MNNKDINKKTSQLDFPKSFRYQNFKNALHLYAQNNISPLAASLVNMRTLFDMSNMTTIL